MGILSSKTRRARNNEEPVKEHLLVTRYAPDRVQKGDMLNVTDICDILAVPLLGVIPESKAILKASNLGVPVTNDYQSDAGMAYNDAIKRLLGKKVPMRFIQRPKQGIIRKLFSRSTV